MNRFIQEHAWLYLSAHPRKDAPPQDDAPTPPDGERALLPSRPRTMRHIKPRRLARLTTLVLRRG